MLFSVPGTQWEKGGRFSLDSHTYSLALSAHHATLDVVVIVLEELVIGHLQLSQLPPVQNELSLEELLCPSAATACLA